MVASIHPLKHLQPLFSIHELNYYEESIKTHTLSFQVGDTVSFDTEYVNKLKYGYTGYMGISKVLDV